MESTQIQSNLNSFNRVFLVDWGYFLHTSIFVFARVGGSIPPTYTAMRMLVSSLKNVGYTKNDLVVVAIDGRGNWRKDVDPNYKANRKELRAKTDVDWYHWYSEFDKMTEKLKASTPFYYIRIDKLEADDIIAVGVTYFKDHECIIVSADSDFEQLYAYPNVKVYSPKSKKYKEVKNPYQVLASKMKKEKSDNLVTPLITEADFKKRMMLVSLLDLPDFVRHNTLDKIAEIDYNKSFDLKWAPFRSLQPILKSLFSTEESKVKVKSKKSHIKKPRKETTQNVIQSVEKIF